MSEWIKHDGGPCPVDGGIRVEVRLRDGATDTRGASDLYWDYAIPREDQIIAYRIVEVGQ